MKITIDETICNKYNMSLSEVLIAILTKITNNPLEVLKEALNREIIGSHHADVKTPNIYYITQHWDDVLCNILLDSEKENIDKEDVFLTSLASALMEIFPKGKKEGTNVYWRGNLKDTKLRLKKFFKLYGQQYSTEQILNAARNYVSSFNGNYSYMRVLKYFIWKDAKKINAEGKIYIDEVSELATLIENEGQENENNVNWTDELV